MERKYYISEIQLDGKIRYFIWFSEDDADGLVTDASAHPPKIMAFKDKADVIRHANNHNITLEHEDSSLLDLDRIASWLENISGDIDCKVFLNGWNMFTDAAGSLDMEFKGDIHGEARNRVYDKLFFGNNIYGITPNGEEYFPEWSEKEVKVIAEIMGQGLALFSGNLKKV